jgi:hypothetical protein
VLELRLSSLDTPCHTPMIHVTNKQTDAINIYINSAQFYVKVTADEKQEIASAILKHRMGKPRLG